MAADCPNEDVALPSFAEAVADKTAFAVMTRDLHRETNPLNARRLTQAHGDRTLVVNPPTRLALVMPRPRTPGPVLVMPPLATAAWMFRPRYDWPVVSIVRVAPPRSRTAPPSARTH